MPFLFHVWICLLWSQEAIILSCVSQSIDILKPLPPPAINLTTHRLGLPGCNERLDLSPCTCLDFPDNSLSHLYNESMRSSRRLWSVHSSSSVHLSSHLFQLMTIFFVFVLFSSSDSHFFHHCHAAGLLFFILTYRTSLIIPHSSKLI